MNDRQRIDALKRRIEQRRTCRCVVGLAVIVAGAVLSAVSMPAFPWLAVVGVIIVVDALMGTT